MNKKNVEGVKNVHAVSIVPLGEIEKNLKTTPNLTPVEELKDGKTEEVTSVIKKNVLTMSELQRRFSETSNLLQVREKAEKTLNDLIVWEEMTEDFAGKLSLYTVEGKVFNFQNSETIKVVVETLRAKMGEIVSNIEIKLLEING